VFNENRTLTVRFSWSNPRVGLWPSEDYDLFDVAADGERFLVLEPDGPQQLLTALPELARPFGAIVSIRSELRRQLI